jgi:hypothetical protein
MTVDIATASMVLVYAGMAGYIVYLQHKLREAKFHAGAMVALIKDMAEGNVTVERRDGKTTISRAEG